MKGVMAHNSFVQRTHHVIEKFSVGNGTSVVSFFNDTAIPPLPSRNTLVCCCFNECSHDTCPGCIILPVLRCPSDRPRIWMFKTFNSIQSALYPTVAKTDRNVVVSAPTGCGKVNCILRRIITRGRVGRRADRFGTFRV